MLFYKFAITLRENLSPLPAGPHKLGRLPFHTYAAAWTIPLWRIFALLVKQAALPARFWSQAAHLRSEPKR